MSEERLWEYIEVVYMTGTIDRIQEPIQARVDAGVEYMSCTHSPPTSISCS